MIELSDGSGIIAGKDNRLWLPKSELPLDAETPELIRCGDIFFDVVGFSEARCSYLISPIKIDGAADNLEAELSTD